MTRSALREAYEGQAFEPVPRRHALWGLAFLGLFNLVAAFGWRFSQPTAPAGATPAFFVSLGIFAITLAAIILPWIHETVAAFAGAVLVWLVHYIGGTFDPTLHIADFSQSMAFVDWNVIFLVLGMMIFMGMFAETGVLRWLAFRAFRLARGNAWALGLILVVLTGLTSSLLNNATTMLLLVPLSIQIAETAGVHPFVYVIPEVLAANIGGAATIIGDPPSTLVGSHIGLSFFTYAVEAAPVVVLSLVALLAISAWRYRRDLAGARARLSPRLVRQLQAEAVIGDVALLRRAGVVGLVTLVLFFVGDRFGLPPSVIALTGATWLMVWVRPDVHRMLREVDWTTLFFFVGLFVLVGALEQTGVVAWLAGLVESLAGNSLTLATVLLVWVAGAISGAVDNIPFTIALLPIVDRLVAAIPASGTDPALYWALIFGADLGGNATRIGSAANIVAAGLLAQAGYRLTFGRFLRDGLVVTLVTLVLATLWLVIRY